MGSVDIFQFLLDGARMGDPLRTFGLNVVVIVGGLIGVLFFGRPV